MLSGFVSTKGLATNVTIRGLERTSESYLRTLLDRCDLNYRLISEVETCLRNTRLFSDISVGIQEDQVQISLKEKWTLITIPRFESSAGDTRYGAFLIESNAFGVGHFAIAGLTFGSRSNSILAGYTFKNVMGSHVFIAGVGAKEEDDISLFRAHDEEIHQMNLRVLRSEFSLGYEFDSLSQFRVSVGTLNHRFDQIEQDETPDDYEATVISADLRLSNANFKQFYEDGANLRLRTQKEITGPVGKHVASAAFVYSFGLMDEGAALITGSRYSQILSPPHPAAFELVGRNRGARGIPENGAWVTKHSYWFGEAMVPVWKPKAGTLVVGAFSEAGRLSFNSSYLADTASYSSMGVLCYFYLRRVAVPGIGIEIGRNNPFSDFFVSVAIGGSRD